MSTDYGQIRKICKDKLLENLDYTRDISDEEIREMIDDCVLQIGRSGALSLQMKKRLQKELFATIRQLDVLEEFLSDNSVTEIMVNGPDCIFIERQGRIQKMDACFESIEKLSDVIQQIVARVNRVVNEASPIVDARLASGARVHVVMPPVALNGPILTIRRFPDHPMEEDDYYRLGSVDRETMNFIKKLIYAKYNIFISGGTGSGKTTFLNVLSGNIPADERIITIEDNAELQIRNISNLVRLETRNANMEGCKAITIRDLIKASLRMRPEGIKIKKGKLKRKKKRIPIPHTFLQHILGNLIPLIRGEVVKIIEEADDLLPLFHSILHVESILPIHGVCTQHSFSE